jgi:hypothetical protein
MDGRRYVGFVLKVMVVHAVTYFVCGAIAYSLVMKQFYVGDEATFAAFMRTEAEPELWRHVMHWFFPAQLLRGLMIGAVLCPFLEVMLSWGYRKRFLCITGLYVVIGYWAATVAAPGTIEGMVYMKPFVTPFHHAIGQLEIVGQGLALGALLGWWMAKKRGV